MREQSRYKVGRERERDTKHSNSMCNGFWCVLYVRAVLPIKTPCSCCHVKVVWGRRKEKKLSHFRQQCWFCVFDVNEKWDRGKKENQLWQQKSRGSGEIIFHSTHKLISSYTRFWRGRKKERRSTWFDSSTAKLLQNKSYSSFQKRGPCLFDSFEIGGTFDVVFLCKKFREREKIFLAPAMTAADGPHRAQRFRSLPCFSIRVARRKYLNYVALTCREHFHLKYWFKADIWKPYLSLSLPLPSFLPSFRSSRVQPWQLAACIILHWI